jgi:hypothetical protein
VRNTLPLSIMQAASWLQADPRTRFVSFRRSQESAPVCPPAPAIGVLYSYIYQLCHLAPCQEFIAIVEVGNRCREAIVHGGNTRDPAVLDVAG